MNIFLTRLEEKLLSVLPVNPSAELPYHNNDHMRLTWQLAKQIWDTEQEDIGLGDPTWGYVVLMFATLFHDWGHSGGKEADTSNVLVARGFVMDLIAKNGYTLPGKVIEAIDSAIAVTEFPFVIHPKNRLEAVLRDADSLYATWNGQAEVILEGLREEMEIRLGHPITYDQMLDGQIEFMAKTTMFTKTAHGIWSKQAPVFVDQMKLYVKNKRGN